MIIIKPWLVPATLLMLCTLMVSGALQVHAQESSAIRLSDQDKSAIVESVLRQELNLQGTEFRSLNVSSENLEFIEPSEIFRLGVRLISPDYIRNSQGVEYVMVKGIEARGNKTIVTLSRAFEGRPCFGPAFSREHNVTYEYRRESGPWTGELIRKPFRQSAGLPDSTRWSRATGSPLRINDAP
jgi:hypothetical protein